jgi:hypothetical protein
MNARFVFACAAAGFAMAAFGAGTASAEEANKGSLGFEYDFIRPGDQTGLFGTCDDPNFTTAEVVSDVLIAEPLWGTDDGAGGWNLHSTGHVAEDAQPGTYPVSFQCGTTTVTANFTVTAQDVPPSVAAIHVDPSKGKPGAVVTVGASCGQGLELTGVTSEALTIGEWTVVGGDPDAVPTWFAEATVRDVKPGEYAVSGRCGDEKVATTFTVTGAVEPVKDAQVPVKPKGAADTGSADGPVRAAPARDADSGDTALLIGAGVALAGAAGGAGVWAYRRRQQH